MTMTQLGIVLAAIYLAYWSYKNREMLEAMKKDFKKWLDKLI